MTKTKKKVALICYGGTITMVVRDNKVLPAEDVSEILKMVPARIERNVSVQVETT